MSVTGKLEKILPTEKITTKAGKEFEKRAFVINTGDEYNPQLCMTLFGDKVGLIDKFQEGQDVEVEYNLYSREYKGNWFHNVDAWKIEAVGSGNTEQPQPPSGNEDESNLPF